MSTGQLRADVPGDSQRFDLADAAILRWSDPVKGGPMKRVLEALALVAVLATAACGGSDSWCPGTICTNCATDPACSVSCPSGKTAACVGGAYFDADPNARCGFCQ
jgi:hypothetical protein